MSYETTICLSISSVLCEVELCQGVLEEENPVMKVQRGIPDTSLFAGGRYRGRTCGLFRVKEALSH